MKYYRQFYSDLLSLWGTIVEDLNPSYKDELDIFIVAIGKYLYSFIEFLPYTKDLWYSKVKEFFCQHIDGGELVVQVTYNR